MKLDRFNESQLLSLLLLLLLLPYSGDPLVQLFTFSSEASQALGKGCMELGERIRNLYIPSTFISSFVTVLWGGEILGSAFWGWRCLFFRSCF